MTQSLNQIIDRVQQLLDKAHEATGTYAEDPRGYHTKLRIQIGIVTDTLAREFDAKITDRWDGSRVRIGGISSTSTSGVSGALQNWLAAAGKRMGQSK